MWTHADVCGAWPNLSPHTLSAYAVHKAVCKMIDQPQSNNDFQHKAAEVSTANIAWLREGRDVIRLYQSPTNAIPNDALLTVGSESSFLKFVRNPGVMMVPNMHHKSPQKHC